WHGTICALLDARMKEVFGAVYRAEGSAMTLLHKPVVGPVESIVTDLPGPLLLIGDGAAVYRDRILAVVDDTALLAGAVAPLASTIGLLAREQLLAGATADVGAVEP